MTRKLPSRSESSKGRWIHSSLPSAASWRISGAPGERRRGAAPGLEQAADLVQGDRAGADQQAGAAFEFEEDGQQAHGRQFDLGGLAIRFSRLRRAVRGRWAGRARRRPELRRPDGRGVRRWCGGRNQARKIFFGPAVGQVLAQQALDGFGHQRRGAAIADRARDGCVLADRSAEAEVVSVGQLALVLDLLAFDADVGDPVLAAAVGAAGDVQPELLVELRAAALRARPPASG